MDSKKSNFSSNNSSFSKNEKLASSENNCKISSNSMWATAYEPSKKDTTETDNTTISKMTKRKQVDEESCTTSSQILEIDKGMSQKSSGIISFTAIHEKSRLTLLLSFVILFAAATGSLMGYDLCIVATILNKVKEEFNICNGEFSCTKKQLFVSMVAPGAMFGSIFGGIISDIIGRKISLAFSDIFFIIGSILLGIGQDYWVLIVGRFFIGMGVGVGFVVFSTYVSELAPPDRRGQLVSCQEVAQCGGCLLSYCIAAIVGTECWRWLIGAAGILAAIQIFGVIILPESPRWYVRKKKLQKAIEVLRRLGDVSEEQVQITANQMQKEFEEEQRITESYGYGTNVYKARFHELKLYKKQVSIAVGCAVCQNMTAANSALYYSSDIFKLAGVVNVFLPGIGLGILKFLGVLSCMLLVEKWGRKRLLMIGSIGTFFCHLLFVTSFAIQDSYGIDFQSISEGQVPLNSSLSAAKLTIATMLIYMYFWNISWAALMFVIASEVLPSCIRGVGMGLTITTFWLLAFVVQLTLETLFMTITKPGTFGFYAFLNFLVIIYVYYVIPETTGQTLEEITNNYRTEQKNKKAKSNPKETQFQKIEKKGSNHSNLDQVITIDECCIVKDSSPYENKDLSNLNQTNMDEQSIKI